MRSNEYKAKQMIVMRKDLGMRKGKIAAQAAHASDGALLRSLIAHKLLDRLTVRGGHLELASSEKHNPLVDWFQQGTAKVCVYVDSEEELFALAREGQERGYLVELVCDAGLTEFHGDPTYTCLAFEPLYPKQIDPLTGDLPLY